MLSETQVARADRLLPIEHERCVLIPNGFDPDNFTPRHIEHRALWQRMLVEQPRGWAPAIAVWNSCRLNEESPFVSAVEKLRP